MSERERGLRDSERPAQADAVGDRPENKGADGAREEHQRQLPSSVGLAAAVRDDPERDEREEAEPRDAPQGDHDRQERHRAEVVPPAG